MSPATGRSLRLPVQIATAGAVSALPLIHLLERFAAALGILLLAPFGVLLALAIFVLSGRSPLVRHRRMGWNGAALRMLKYRTMWSGSAAKRTFRMVEDVSGSVPVHKEEHDARVTSRLAAFCRQYSLDELPQLWHVVRGEMSLVGPRPITAREIHEHYGAAAPEVLAVRPGLAGMWQTMGRNKLTYAQRRRLDLFWARRASASLYLRILFRAVPAVVRGTGAC